GLAYSFNLFNERLRTVVFSKLFLMKSTGFEGDRYSKTDSTLVEITASYNKKAYGIASTFFLTEKTQLKLSYENTYRMPEPAEMFGNGLALLSNLDIKPEESRNFNAGILSNKIIGNHRVLAELEYLYRLPEN